MKLPFASSAISLAVYLHGCHAFSPSRSTRSVVSSSLSSSPQVVDSPVAKSEEDEKSLTQRIMEKTSAAGQTGGAGGVSTWDAFLRADENWSRLKSSKAFEYDKTVLSAVQNGVPPPPQFVTDDGASGNPRCWEKLRKQAVDSTPLDYDVTICGGTLGIFIAMALQLKGHNVAVLEAGKLRGREQEWNISMKELLELVELGVLTEEDIDMAVKTEFPGCRALCSRMWQVSFGALKFNLNNNIQLLILLGSIYDKPTKLPTEFLIVLGSEDRFLIHLSDMLNCFLLVHFSVWVDFDLVE